MIALLMVSPLPAAARQQLVRMERAPEAKQHLVLRESLRIGDLEGPNAFGRIMDATLDGRGRILAVDDLNKSLVLYGSDGKLVAAAGRNGEGPGEFRQPWAVAVDLSDSVFVWDAELARISVFDPSLRYSRVLRVAPHRLVNGIEFLPNGNLLIAAFGPGDDRGLFEVDRSDGSEVSALGPVMRSADLAGFEASLLGGYVEVVDSTIVYSTKSPYTITFLNSSGVIVRNCIGDRTWTSDPETVVLRTSEGEGLQWTKYVHVAELISLPNALWLNVIRDPVRNRKVLDVVDTNCRLLARQELDGSVHPIAARGGKLLAVRTLDYSELVVYELDLR